MGFTATRIIQAQQNLFIFPARWQCRTAYVYRIKQEKKSCSTIGSQKSTADRGGFELKFQYKTGFKATRIIKAHQNLFIFPARWQCRT